MEDSDALNAISYHLICQQIFSSQIYYFQVHNIIFCADLVSTMAVDVWGSVNMNMLSHLFRISHYR